MSHQRTPEVVLTVLGPVANLALASGGISLILLLLHVQPVIFGMAIFGFYVLGLSIIYFIMRPVVHLVGLAAIMKLAILMCLFAFLAFLLAFLGGY